MGCWGVDAQSSKGRVPLKIGNFTRLQHTTMALKALVTFSNPKKKKEKEFHLLEDIHRYTLGGIFYLCKTHQSLKQYQDGSKWMKFNFE